MFIAALFLTVKKRKQAKYPPTKQLRQKMRLIHLMMEYDSVSKIQGDPGIWDNTNEPGGHYGK